MALNMSEDLVVEMIMTKWSGNKYQYGYIDIFWKMLVNPKTLPKTKIQLLFFFFFRKGFILESILVLWPAFKHPTKCKHIPSSDKQLLLLNVPQCSKPMFCTWFLYLKTSIFNPYNIFISHIITITNTFNPIIHIYKIYFHVFLIVPYWLCLRIVKNIYFYIRYNTYKKYKAPAVPNNLIFIILYIES